MLYREFWEIAFQVARDKNFQYPYPNTFGNKDLLAEVEKREAAMERIKVAEFPYFKPEAYKGYPLQKRYYVYLAGAMFRKYGSIESIKRAVDVGAMHSDFYENDILKRKRKGE